MVTSLKRSYACTATLCPQTSSRPPPTHTSTRDPRPPTGKSRAVFCGVTAPFFWVLVHKVLLCPLRVYLPVLCKFWHLSVQFSSIAESCPTLCNPMNYSTTGLPVHLQLPGSLKLRSIPSVMPSSHLIPCRPLLLLPPIPLGRSPSGIGSSWLLPLTSDVGQLLSAALSATRSILITQSIKI